METEDIINLSTSIVSEIESENGDNGDYDCKPNRTPLPGEADSMDEDLDNSHSTFQDSDGVKLTETVSFWMDDRPRKKNNKDFTPFDANSVPLYDRGFSFTLSSTDGSSNLEGGLQVVNASRCFNCGSYSHSLKDCPKPRDNVAVNIARKQHKLKRNQNAANPSRYYQSSPKGKYDGLKPGVLDPETRKLLGLGELDPPPWLHRMQKIGYPPRYLGPEDDDLPSGITIYGDDEIKELTEEGEILENSAEPPKAMIIEFPDKATGPSSITASRTHSYSSKNKSNNPMSGHEQHRSRGHIRRRLSGIDGEGPPHWRFSGIEGERPPHWRFSGIEGERPSGIEGERPPHWLFSGIEGERLPHWRFSGIEGERPPHWRFSGIEGERPSGIEDERPPHWRFSGIEGERPSGIEDERPHWLFSGIECERPPYWRFRDFEGKFPPRSQFEFINERPPGCELNHDIIPYRDYASINGRMDGFSDRFRRSRVVHNHGYLDYASINGPMDDLERLFSDRFRRSPVVHNHAFYHTW